jgi:hypothetical protein
LHTPRILVLIGGAILCIAARLPWMSAPILFGVQGTVPEALEIGWEDNGFITGGAGLILLLVGALYKGKPGKRYTIPGAALALLAVFVVAGCFKRILDIDPSAGIFAATDVGIYLTLIGALLALFGALSRVPRLRLSQDNPPVAGDFFPRQPNG